MSTISRLSTVSAVSDSMLPIIPFRVATKLVALQWKIVVLPWTIFVYSVAGLTSLLLRFLVFAGAPPKEVADKAKVKGSSYTWSSSVRTLPSNGLACLVEGPLALKSSSWTLPDARIGQHCRAPPSARRCVSEAHQGEIHLWPLLRHTVVHTQRRTFRTPPGHCTLSLRTRRSLAYWSAAGIGSRSRGEEPGEEEGHQEALQGPRPKLHAGDPPGWQSLAIPRDCVA
jgi:hypothetical protein